MEEDPVTPSTAMPTLHRFDCSKTTSLERISSLRKRTPRTQRGHGPLIAKLKRFQKSISMISNQPYPCPRRPGCFQWIKPGKMERHFRIIHPPFDPAVACVWCDGAFDWPRGQKNRHIDHMSQCFRSYRERVDRHPPEQREEPPMLTLEQEEVSWIDVDGSFSEDPSTSDGEDCVCPDRPSMRGRKSLLSEYAYGPLFLDIDPAVFPKRRVSNRLEFEDVVERARFYLDLYCQWNRVGDSDDGTYDSSDEEDNEEEEETVATWYHVMVSAFALDRFVQAVMEFGQDKVFALPVWCWCDGAPYKQDMFRHHRHMILVVRNGCQFRETCWATFCRGAARRMDGRGEVVLQEDEWRGEDDGSDTIVDDDALPNGFCMGHLRKIRTWLQLAITMMDLCVPHTVCCYDFKSRKRRGELKEHHFCFGQSWHPLEMLCLVCVTSSNGIKGLFDQEERRCQFSQRWAPQCFLRVPSHGGPWHVRVGDVKGQFHAVLPVKKEWRPVRILCPDDVEELPPDSGFVFLMEGKKLVFERDASLVSLSEDTWTRVQTQGGAAKNLFYDVVADSYYKLNPSIQASLDFGEKFACFQIEKVLAEKTAERAMERNEEAWRWREKEVAWATQAEELRKELASLRVNRAGEPGHGSNVTVLQYWTVGNVYYQAH